MIYPVNYAEARNAHRALFELYLEHDKYNFTLGCIPWGLKNGLISWEEAAAIKYKKDFTYYELMDVYFSYR